MAAPATTDPDVLTRVKARLERWAIWCHTEHGYRDRVSWCHAPGDPEYHSAPLLTATDDEALATERAIARLPDPERKAVVNYWLRYTVPAAAAHACRCSERRLYSRLRSAYVLLAYTWGGCP